MSRSRLHPYRAAIEEAVAAGTSVANLARTYGVVYSTMEEFLTGYPNRHNTLQKCQYDTLVATPRRKHARQETT